ncbi:MAG: TonB-dependent receptor [Prolixibacteraceae bacterium]|nr:TonB-dependent receptor [Prolixibacteraceae bacterium]
MRKVVLGFILVFVLVLNVNAQKAVLRGTVSDLETGETIVGASVFLDGTTTGAMTDFDGRFEMKNITPGNYMLKCSFISYEPQQKEIVLAAGDEKNIDFKMGEAVVHVDEVKVVARANRENETMLLIEQKEAEGIKESIGAQRLSSLGVSDAASATSKISGVTKNEGSGDIYIRGLGDRYLSTTMNGLPVPSDDVAKKNIDLNLFSTDVIKNVGISKTYSVDGYADQSSGSVDIRSKTHSNDIEVEVSAGSNTNVFSEGVWGNFRGTQNANDLALGFYTGSVNTEDAVKNQSWNTTSKSFPLNRSLAFMAGKKFDLFNNEFSFFATLSHDNSFDYKTGIYKKYRSNVLDNSFNDVETFTTNYNTTGLLNFTYDFSANHSMSFNSLAVIKTIDELYEQGRNGEGYVFDQDPQEYGAFVRDQNLKTTQMYINQVHGKHQLNKNNKLQWALGYNFVNSEEPNRIRNEVNIMDEQTVQFAHVGDFQQRKSSQDIEDAEFNGYLKNEQYIINEENNKLKINYGANARYKTRDFSSLFIGVRAKGVQVQSVDNLDEAFLNKNLYNSRELIVRDRKPDLYNAILGAYAGYVNANYNNDKLSGTIGLRYEHDILDVNWDVANYVGRKGSLSNQYDNILPSFNFKYNLTEKSALRIAAGKTITLPEFKELSPFEYVSPTGRVTKGNPDLMKSVNYNFDVKWELFPTNKELVSLTGFYKRINNPINLTQTRGSSGNFIYENTGEMADVYGVEAETRVVLIKPENTGQPGLEMVLNATKMWFNQDLIEEFRYNNKTETELQGAAGFIANASLSYSNNNENKFEATITGNYSSDKILALGAPEDFVNSATLFNSEIIEKGFTTVDLVLSKKISDKVSVKFTGKNLLNPEIKQTQEIKPLSGDPSNAVVSSYKKGISLKLGLTIKL